MAFEFKHHLTASGDNVEIHRHGFGKELLEAGTVEDVSELSVTSVWILADTKQPEWMATLWGTEHPGEVVTQALFPDTP